MRSCVLFLCGVLAWPTTGRAQHSLELTGGAGYTVVDVDGIVEKDEIAGTSATDWDQFSYSVSAQYFFHTELGVGFGGEVMWQYLYWYNVRVPFGSAPIHRGYDVSATRVSALARFLPDRLFSVDVGPSLNFLEETTIGGVVSANLNLRLSNMLAIPIKVRVDLFENIELVAAISAHAGVRIYL